MLEASWDRRCGEKMRKFLVVSAVLSVLTALAPSALAQAAVAKVISLNGEFGSVLVLRGSETFSLMDGDDLFAGDQVFTRTNGQVSISGFGCERGLGGRMSISISASNFCTAPLNTLSPSETIGGTQLGIGVGQTPGLLLPLLAAGAAGGAAGALSNDDQPASP